MATTSNNAQAKCPACGAIYQSHYATCLVDGETLEIVTSPGMPTPVPRRRWLMPILLGGGTAVAGALAMGIVLSTRTPPLEPLAEPLRPDPEVEAAAIRRIGEAVAAPGGHTAIKAGGTDPAEGTDAELDEAVAPEPAEPEPAEPVENSTEVVRPVSKTIAPAKRVQEPVATPMAEPEPEPEPASFRANDLKNPFD